MAAPGDAVAGIGCNEGALEQAAETGLEAIFRAEYKRIARVLARVTRDPARAEELAVEVFLKWDRTPRAHGEHARGWLYRTAVRTGLKELRAETRRARHERLFVWIPQGRAESRSPESLHAESEGQRQVRRVLSGPRWVSSRGLPGWRPCGRRGLWYGAGGSGLQLPLPQWDCS